MPAALDIVIGLSFVFLLFSLVVTAANEIWLSLLDQRTRFLRQGLRDLFHEYHHPPLPGWWRSLLGVCHLGWLADWVSSLFGRRETSPASPTLLGDFYDHGLINAFSKGKGAHPAYIAPEVFATVILDLLTRKAAGPDGGPAKGAARVKQLQMGIQAIAATNPHMAQSLGALLAEANGRPEAFRKLVEGWFNDCMDRVTGWYKRYAQQWLLLLGLLLAIVCNVDSVHLVRVLSTDPTLRAAIVTQAATYAQTRPADADKKPGAAKDPVLAGFKDAVGNLGGLALPIGWDGGQARYFCEDFHCFAVFAGWFITALAASLGAPFWFDTLNRFITVRGNGRAPDEKALTTKKEKNPLNPQTETP
jgi:hypothetical protein